MRHCMPITGAQQKALALGIQAILQTKVPAYPSSSCLVSTLVLGEIETDHSAANPM
jgi:hypothetical protein